jgi:hypothetical protein
MTLLSQPTDTDRELEKNATAVYQVADDLYMHDRYRIDRELPATQPSAPEVKQTAK